MKYDLLSVTLNPSLDREVVVDNFKIDQLFRINNPSNSVMDPGGKGINVSLMLSTLGINSINTGFLGGFIGKVIQKGLSSVNEITTNFVYTRESTRENIEILDTINNTITEVNSMGPFITEEDYEHFLKRYKSTISLTKNVLISGSIPPGVPISSYSKLLELAKSENKRTFLEAIGPHFDQAIRENCPDVIRVDLRKRTSRVLGNKLEKIEDFIETGKEILNYGAKLVVMSFHIVGDVIVTNDGIWLFTVKEEIDNSHLLGTGDAFMAGIIYYLIKNELNYFEAAKYGMASAISSARYIGKILGNEEEVKNDLDKFEIKRLD